MSVSLSGPRLVNVTNASEMSTLTVDPAVRASSSSFTQSAMPRSADSDASKVVSRGTGLSKAFVGQKSSFTVDCSKAGKDVMMLYKPKTCFSTNCVHLFFSQINVAPPPSDRYNLLS